MEIELSEDLQHYKESFILGLTVKQTFFSILALGTGTAVVLLLYNRVGVTLSCYVATPFVVPLALTGFYHYHGLTFWQFAGKMVHFAFFNRPLLYCSTESMEELERIVSKEKQEEQKNRKESLETRDAKGSRKKKKCREKNAESEKNKSRKNRKRNSRNSEMNQEIKVGKVTECKRKKSGPGQPGKNRMRSKKKRRRHGGMATVVKRRKPAGLIAVMVIGWLLTLTALLAIGAAVAAGWYGQYR